MFWSLRKWQDRIPDVEVLHRAHTVSFEALITVLQLRWAGHVRRMANSRLLKAVFYLELRQRKRSPGGQTLRFKDVLKRHMNKTGISHDTWEEEAVQRVKWRGLLRKATSAVKEQRQQEYLRAHERLHSAATSSSFQGNNCQCYYRSRTGLTAHESMYKIGLNSITRQSSSATKCSHQYKFSKHKFHTPPSKECLSIEFIAWITQTLEIWTH